MPQFVYGEQPRLLLGQVYSMDAISKDSYINPLLPQIDTVAFAGLGSGTYTIQIQGEEGTFDVSVTATPATAADFVVAFDSDEDLDNIVEASDDAGDLVLTFLIPGRDYKVFLTANPSSDMTLTSTQAPGGPTLGLGVAVAYNSGDPETSVEALSAATTAGDIAGVTVRNLNIEFNRGNRGGFNGTDEFFAGECVTVGRQGEFCVQVENAVTAGQPCFVRIQNVPTSSVAGAFRSDADGGDAIQLPASRFRTSTSGPGLAVVTVNIP